MEEINNDLYGPEHEYQKKGGVADQYYELTRKHGELSLAYWRMRWATMELVKAIEESGKTFTGLTEQLERLKAELGEEYLIPPFDEEDDDDD